MVQNYDESVSIGSWAIDAILPHLRERSFTVDDVTKDPFFQSLDVDLVLRHEPTGAETWVEVKADTYKTGNVYIETVSNRERDTPGCIVYTQADRLIYYMLRFGLALVMPVPALQSWVRGNAHHFPRHVVPNYARSGDLLFTSEGHTVPSELLVVEVQGSYWIYNLPIWKERK